MQQELPFHYTVFVISLVEMFSLKHRIIIMTKKNYNLVIDIIQDYNFIPKVIGRKNMVNIIFLIQKL